MGIAERREREREHRRLQITEAAKRVFSARGYSGATMESIAQEAELSPATLYLYYKGKDELFAALNLEMLRIISEQMEGICAREDWNPEEKINGLEEALYEVYRKDPVNLRNMLRFQSSEALWSLSPEIAAQIKNQAARSLRLMARIFEEGMAEGLFRQQNPVALADVVWSLFSGLVLWEESKRGFDPKKDFLKSTLCVAIEVLKRGIRRAGDPPRGKIPEGQ